MSHRKTIPGFLLLLIGGLMLVAIPTGICSAQGRGHGGGGGHGNNGGGHGNNGGGHGNNGGGHGNSGGGYGHNGGSNNFFGFGPGGFTYGYSDKNFGIVVGPVGGGYYRDGGGYYGGGCQHSAPVYAAPVYADPIYSAPVVSGPAVIVQPASQPGPAVSQRRSVPLIESTAGAREFVLQAEQAFYEHDYQAAAAIIRHAMVEDFENGKIHLFNSQILFAIQEYDGAAEALGVAMQFLDRAEWGYMVENFRSFYSNGDYVKQMDALVAYNKENADAVAPRVLRGYHYLYLGYPESAEKQFRRALNLDPENTIALEFMSEFEEIPAPAPDDDESDTDQNS